MHGDSLRPNRAPQPAVAESEDDARLASCRDTLLAYAKPRTLRSLADVITSVVPYLTLSAMIYAAIGVSPLLALALAGPAAAFLLRTYIVFHDCAHGSFLNSRRANAWLGTGLGLLVFSPFVRWRHDHAASRYGGGSRPPRRG
jgi:omega-6 fatty acid desaturase (delta-12 desaturase)